MTKKRQKINFERINNRINQAKVYTTKTNKNNTGVHMSTKLEKKLIYYHQKKERKTEKPNPIYYK